MMDHIGCCRRLLSELEALAINEVMTTRCCVVPCTVLNLHVLVPLILHPASRDARNSRSRA